MGDVRERELIRLADVLDETVGERGADRVALRNAARDLRSLAARGAVPEGDDRVLWGIVANAGRLSGRRVMRWAHVSDATGLGSQSSIALCRRFGFDPDENVGGCEEGAEDAAAPQPAGEANCDWPNCRCYKTTNTDPDRFQFPPPCPRHEAPQPAGEDDPGCDDCDGYDGFGGHCLMCGKDLSAPEPAPSAPADVDRDAGGRIVREAWVRWAQQQPNPKPSWLAPYDELSEPDKEADRQIFEAVARFLPERVAMSRMKDRAIEAHRLCNEARLRHPDVPTLGDDGELHKAIHAIVGVDTPSYMAPADVEALDWITDDMSGIQIVDQVRILAQFNRIEDDEIVRALGVAIRRLSGAQQADSESITGELVEIGDDDEGQPRLVIHTTRDAIAACRASLLFKPVVVQAAKDGV